MDHTTEEDIREFVRYAIPVIFGEPVSKFFVTSSKVFGALASGKVFEIKLEIKDGFLIGVEYVREGNISFISYKKAYLFFQPRIANPPK